MKRIRTKAELIESFSLTNVNCITAEIYIYMYIKSDLVKLIGLKTCLYDSQVRKKKYFRMQKKINI